MSRNSRFSSARGGAARRNPPGGRIERAPTEHRGWRTSSEELFGREPFTYGRQPRYYGTGVAGYTSGPGFTGGYYGFGDEPFEVPTELEREYLHDVYGTDTEGAGGYAAGALPPGPRRSPSRERPIHRYPPGPKGYRRSDERIREDICDLLMQADHIDSSDVTVEVSGAKVVLEGTVPDRRMKHAIEDLADACLGVGDVDNRIRVKGRPEPL